jgi:hypothetical protein
MHKHAQQYHATSNLTVIISPFIDARKKLAGMLALLLENLMD